MDCRRQAVAPTIDGCDITADRLAALSADMAAPYSLRVHWDGAKVCVTQMVLISYGYKCSECANLFIGNDETKETITAYGHLLRMCLHH